MITITEFLNAISPIVKYQGLQECLRFKTDQGETLEMRKITIRKDGTNETGTGLLLHNIADEAGENDRISGGLANIELDESTAETLLNTAQWSKNFRIDGHNFYLFTE